MEDRLRVFIAVDIDEPLLVSAIDRIKDSIVSTGVPMKPVESQNYHITLRFIGEIPYSLVEEIKRNVLVKITFNKFKITLKGLGAFPSNFRPRVVWIGVSDGFDELKKLRDAIEKNLRKLGLPPEKEKGFSPHLTLARIKGSRNVHSLIKIIDEYKDYVFGSMEVKSIKLKKSILTRSGPIYETLMEVKSY